MKKQLLLLSVVLVTMPLFGQADLQWLVLKGSGKDGTSNPTTNNYANAFGGNMIFNIDGIAHPNLGYYAYNKNDLFIIYQDGTFYNSRVKPAIPNPGFFYSNTPGATNHRFLSTKPIQYLYLSNIYERDDPPGGVKAKAGGGQPYHDSFNIPANLAAPEPLSANHDIIRNSDITLILDKAKIFASAAAQNLDAPDTFDFDLYFNSVFAPGQPPITNVFFQPNPVFESNAGPDVAIYPDGFGSYDPILNKITIKKDCPNFMYVNLRPSTLLNQYYPGIDGIPSHQATFTVTTDAGQPIFAINEDIRSSHDPNFIRIDRICKLITGEYIVLCHLEFENDSHTSPDQIKVTFKLPENADKTCFQVLDWNIAGQTVSGTSDYTRSSRKAVCTFHMGGYSIQKCDTPLDEPQCTGYINFSYKIRKGYPVEDVKTNIFVRKPIVKFDTTDFQVTTFEDLIDVKFTHSTYTYSRPVSGTHCPIDCSH